MTFSWEIVIYFVNCTLIQIVLVKITKDILNESVLWKTDRSSMKKDNLILLVLLWSEIRRVWRYQRGNQNPYIKEGQTTQWPSERGQTMIY